MFEIKTSNADSADVASIGAIITAATIRSRAYRASETGIACSRCHSSWKWWEPVCHGAERWELHHPKAITHQVSINGGELQTRSLLSRSCRGCWSRLRADSAAQCRHS